MKQIWIPLVALFLNITLGHAQWHEPKAVTEKFFPDPDIEMDLPVFKKKRGFTSYSEMTVFLDELRETHPMMLDLHVIGKTQKGREIPMVTLSNKKSDSGKLRILLFARVHGDEPAVTEAMLYFIQQMATDHSLHYLLDKLNFYVIPMLNADGAETMSRRTANNIDMNRDQSKLSTPEAQLLHNIVNQIEPHVSVDFHEYQPVRTDYLRMEPNKVIATPWDVMFLYSGNPNVPISLRNTVDDPFLSQAREKLDEHGLTHHTYYSSSNSYGNITIPIGGASPRSTSNAMALKNMISILVETRGINQGRTSLKRRIMGSYLSALSIAETTYYHSDTVLQAIEDAIKDRGDVVVRFTSEKVEGYELPYLDVINNELITLNVNASFNTKQRATQTRPLPNAYYILPSEYEAVRILQNMGVEVTMLPIPEEKTVEIHTVTTARESGSEVGGVYPLSVRVNTETKTVQLPAGTFRVDTRQKRVRAATVLLEPESSNGFVNYRVIDVQVGNEVPVYRFSEQSYSNNNEK